MIKSFICGVAGTTLTPEERDFLTIEQPYGVILFARNIESPAQVKQLVAAIKSCLTHPYASILIDQEGGRVARLKPPHWRAYPPALQLACGTQPERSIYVNARLIAQELRDLGITTDCAPLADVLSPGCHDVIGDRAFGEDPQTVAKLARAQANGLRDGGILTVLKHIPGHGRSTLDTHEALPAVHASLAELEATDFVPFRALNDLPLAMTAHILYTALDAARVATLSPTVIQYIREQIGFNGLLMSDDLSMKALGGTYEYRTEMTLAAGCDLVLHCNGNLLEMQAVARQSIPLTAAAHARAKAAHEGRVSANVSEEAKLLTEWQQFLAAA